MQFRRKSSKKGRKDVSQKYETQNWIPEPEHPKSKIISFTRIERGFPRRKGILQL